MAYKVLYRKYRPQDFNNLYGQDNIKKLLIDSIINDKLSHAYIFSGPRGTGKTSTAKLFAKTINCENQTNGIPCNSCKSCLNYEQSPDIIEIDAASNNGVDEIRELRDNAKILPTYSKYKIYIIDEVHMLSQSAWNAFLKILEEPPKHIIFILATTELQKIPITILSRCQRFNFQRISNDIIKDNILRISQNENIKITNEAAEYLAILSDGGMRDALSLLDQLSKENTNITKELIIQTFGVLTENEVELIFNYLEQGKIDQINQLFDEYFKKGLDINLLVSKIINYLYKVELEILNNHQLFLNVEEIKRMAAELINCFNKQDGLTLVKMILLSYINPNVKQKDAEIISREIISEPIIPKNDKKDINPVPKKEKSLINQANIEEIKKIRINNSFVGANKQEKEKFKKNWETFINTLTLKNNIEMLSIIEDANIEVVSPTNILFSHKSPSTVVLFNEMLKNLEQEFLKITKIKANFLCLTVDEWNIEKKKYIENKNKKYEFIEEPSVKKINDKSLNTAINIFDEGTIEIK
jgi:DNA polymerase-3 subunit gamma/tau